MLPAEAAVAATCLFVMTCCTVQVSNKHTDDFIDTNSWEWYVYAVTTVAAYLFGMMMGVFKTSFTAYLVIVLTIASCVALMRWHAVVVYNNTDLSPNEVPLLAVETIPLQTEDIGISNSKQSSDA